MLFNSLHFLLFFIIVTLSYYSLPWRGRWVLLLVASCYFYMVFVPYYILILFFTIIIDYFAGIWIEKTHGVQRKFALIVSLISNIGILAYFKYYNFFLSNLGIILDKFHLENPLTFLSIALPIGLSFHTFQAMSYTIEVYRGNQKVERHFGIYALYVMFYPQLVAGPIERPQNVLHQFHEDHPYDWEKVKSGLLLMAWGMFKKVVIADRLSQVVDFAYNNHSSQNGLTLLVATFFFTFQIYCDFSGYSDIALGAARVMGFDLMENFRTPYFAKSISEFWRRWHISLSTWFRDYLYIPLGGNRVSEGRIYFNLFFVFMMSGLWHGANWTYVAWGALHGIYLLLARFRDKYLTFIKLPENKFSDAIHLSTTFVLVMITWVFFRTDKMSIKVSFNILNKIVHTHLSDLINAPFSQAEMWFCVLLIIFLCWKDKFYYQLNSTKNWQFYVLFGSLVVFSYLFGVFGANQFIYFQF